MKVTTSTKTTHLFTLDDEIELELPQKPSWLMEHREPVIQRSDNKIVIGYLVDDEWDRGYFFDEYGQGKFYNLGMNRLKPNITKEDPRELYERLCRENSGRVFLVDCFQHGNSVYSISGDGPNCQFDTAKAAFIYVAPEDAANPEEYARGVMKEYTDWVNGNIFCVVVVTYKKQEDGSWAYADEDANGEIIGDDHAYKSIEYYMPKEASVEHQEN